MFEFLIITGTLHPARSSLEGSMEQMSITTDGIKREMHSVQGKFEMSFNTILRSLSSGLS